MDATAFKIPNGAPGAEARVLFESIQPDFEQPGHVIDETGLPILVLHTEGGGSPEWMVHGNSLYAMFAGQELFAQIPAPWERISVREFRTADRARRAAYVPAPAGR